MNLNLRKFDIRGITPDKVCIFIGKRETGKSFLVKDLLWHHRAVPIGTVISGTEAANTFYGDIVPSLFIHDAYTPEIVANTLKRQKLVIDKVEKQFLVEKDLLLAEIEETYDISTIGDKIRAQHALLLTINSTTGDKDKFKSQSILFIIRSKHFR